MIRDIHIDTKEQSEDELQQKCFFWHWNNYPTKRNLLFHVPNGGSRSKREGARFKAMGVIPGVSDLILLDNCKTHMIELKVKNRNQKPNQLKWEKIVTKEGFDYYVAKSLIEFKAVIHLIYGDS